MSDSGSDSKDDGLHHQMIEDQDEMVNRMLLPSHPNFDRREHTSEEFIELLLSEINDLKIALKSKDIMITNFQAQLEHFNVDSTGVLIANTHSHLRTPDEDVPQRSARRKLSQKGPEEAVSSAESDSRRESIASITSNGPIAAIDGMPLSSNFRSELSAALGITTSNELSPQTSRHDLNVPGLDETPRILNSDDVVDLTVLNTNIQGVEFDQNASNKDVEGTANELISSRKASNPSVNSYKSRIKLPPTLKQPDLTCNAPSTPLINQESHPMNNQISFKNKADLAAEAAKNQEPRLPLTPDGLSSNGKFFARTEASGQLSEDSHSYFGSPFTNSPPNSSMTPTTNSNMEISKTPNTHTFASTDSFHSYQRPSSQTPGSSFHVLSTPKLEDESVELFIKPEEFQSIRIHVVSTISANTKKADDPNCTLSINDKETSKEMWRIRKTLSQLVAFDAEIRPVVEFFGLPPLPEKSLFSSTTPLKVDSRRISLQNYFNTLFVMPHVPRLVLFRICRFLSLDFVNLLDDFRTGAKKEGFLIRRYKGLGLGTAWKVRWCQVDGPELEIYDSPGGNLLELIKLIGSQIGRQSSDTVAEQRGYRHAFLILENAKISKLSASSSKHFFCSESDSERDEWVAAMVEYTENDPLASNDDQNSLQELDSPHVMLNEDFDQSNRYLSGTSSNYAHLSFEADSSFVTILDESQREAKRATRKKSRFPFRNRVSTHSETHVNQQENQIVSSPQRSELPMQTYLDQMKLSDEPARVIFGRDIEEAFRLSNHSYNGRQVPSICYRCLDFLSKTGAVYEEGIFRLSGSASSIRQLKENFNSVHDVDLFESPLRPDMHTVAGLLKTYLRELPNPVFGRKAYSELLSLVSQTGGSPNSSTVYMMRDFLRDSGLVSKVNFDFCVTIFGYLRSVITKSSTNKMSLRNVCIVFVPTLNISIDILSVCLTDFDCIFGNGDPIPDEKRLVLDLQIPTF